MSAISDTQLIIFAKAPIAGAVKTRLAPLIGAQGAADLQAALIVRTVQVAARAGFRDVSLHAAPDASHPLFARLARDYGIRLATQRGDDLGARMAHALEEALPPPVVDENSAAPALLIGTDCPLYDSAYLNDACALLAAGSDCVLGPAEDGGYVLIGMRRFIAGAFANVDWSTSRVLAQTRRNLRAAGVRWRELQPLWDVDRAEDLARLRARTTLEEKA